MNRISSLNLVLILWWIDILRGHRNVYQNFIFNFEEDTSLEFEVDPFAMALKIFLASGRQLPCLIFFIAVIIWFLMLFDYE